MAALTFAQLRHLARLAQRARFEPGSLLFKEWSEGDSMLVLRKGKVRVYKSFFGKSQTLATRTKGAILGEMALIEGGPRSASVEAVTPVEALTFDREAALEFLEAYPRVAVDLLGELSGRLRTVQQDLVEQLMSRNLELELATARLEARLKEAHMLEESNQELTQLASRDHLTGVLNRRALDSETRRWLQDPDLPCTFMLMDVDNFKHYNDTNGHPAGDKLLKTLASVVNSKLRADDRMGRYGGEEFGVLFFGLKPERSGEVAERVRQAIEEYPFPDAHKQPLKLVSISAGVAHFPSEATDPEALVKLADDRLYQAKKSGRNRIVSV